MMRVFQSGTDAQGHWLAYVDPEVHFVESTTTDGKQHFFYLPFRGMVIYSPGMAGKLSAGWPWIAMVDQCPINKDGSISKRAKFFTVPLGHCYSNGGVCIYNRVPRPNIQSVFAEFWQSKSTYFVEEAEVAKYVHKNYKGMLTGSIEQVATAWSHFVKTDFFDDWENNWTLENIAKAPFMNFPIDEKKLRGSHRYPTLDSVGPWREVETPQVELQVVEDKPVAMAAKK